MYQTRTYYDRKKKEWQVVSSDGLSAAWGDTKEKAQENFNNLMGKLEEKGGI